MTEELDRRFMAAAIRLGASALGTTAPNPAVGAILVNDGHVVGRGRTAPGGRPHAETTALAMAGEKARGATLYVSLEPCAHHGRTPPCADAIISAGVGRVVAPMADPDSRVAGKGFERLRDAGVEVVVGRLADEAKRAHAGHLNRTRNGRPHVVLKLAVSADDAIGRTGGGQVAVTGGLARRHVQAKRARFDAILVGRGSVEADDPQLTCRLPGLEDRSPIRVVLDSDERLDGGRKVFDGAAPTWLMHAGGGDSSEGTVRRLSVPRGPGGLDVRAAMTRLAEEGVGRLLVEGGALVARSFLQAGVVDTVMLFRSDRSLGGAIVPALAGMPLSEVESSKTFRRVARRRFGPDRMTLYERAS